MIDVRNVLQTYITQNINTDSKLVAGVINFAFEEYNIAEERAYVICKILENTEINGEEIKKIINKGK